MIRLGHSFPVNHNHAFLEPELSVSSREAPQLMDANGWKTKHPVHR